MAKKPITPVHKPLPKVEAPIFGEQNPLYRKIFLGLIAVLLLAIPFFSKDAGINGDERFQVYMCRYMLPFYTSLGKDRRVLLKNSEVLPVYKKSGMEGIKKEFNIDIAPQCEDFKNGGYEFLDAVLNKLFGYERDDMMAFHTLRHILVGIIAVLVMLFAGLVAKELLSWRAALITVMLLAVSPIFIGHAIMNEKDMSFAFGYIVTFYFILRFIKQLPFPGPKVTVGLMLGIAATISIRIGGLMLVGYLGIFSSLFWYYSMKVKNDPAFNTVNLRNSMLKAFVACFFGYFMGLIFWPFCTLDPISNPFIVLHDESAYPIFINQLFEGKTISSKDLPWYYLPKLIFITTPLIVLLGLALASYMVFRFRRSLRTGLIGATAFVIVFPLAYIIYKHSNVYNSWRHVLFVYPPLVVLAALGYDLLIEAVKAKGPRIGVIVGMVLLSIMPAAWIVAEHPHEYVYFNELEGGIKGAYGNYTTDYWMMSLREATEWLVKNEINKGTKKVVVASDCVYPVSVYLKNMTDKADPMYCSYSTRDYKDWDYGIFYSEFVSPYQMQKGLWPPDGTIYIVKADGVPLCAVVKRTTKADMEGHNAMEAKDYPRAIKLLEEAKIAYPKNEVVLSDLGLAYLSAGNVDVGIETLKTAVRLNPENPMTYYYIGIAYAQTNPPQYEITMDYMRKALKVNPDFEQARQVIQQLQGLK